MPPPSSVPSSGRLAPIDAHLADLAATFPTAVRSAILTGAAHAQAGSVPSSPSGSEPPTARTWLDLGTVDAQTMLRAVAADLTRPPHLREAVDDGLNTGPFIAACSWGALPAFSDLVATFTALRSVLAPAASFFFSEPVARPGMRRVVQATFEARRPELRELHLARDVNAALREAGFVIDTVHRQRVAGAPLLLRYVASGRACVVDPPLAEDA